MPNNIKYTRHDLADLISRLDVDKAQLDHLFGYRDPKTLDRKISGEMALTGQDQHIIDMLSDSADAGVRRLYRKEAV